MSPQSEENINNNPLKNVHLWAKNFPLSPLPCPVPWQEIPENVASVVLEGVDVEVDWWVDGGEEVGELHRVLHPGGPHKISLDKMISQVFIPQ